MLVGRLSATGWGKGRHSFGQCWLQLSATRGTEADSERTGMARGDPASPLNVAARDGIEPPDAGPFQCWLMARILRGVSDSRWPPKYLARIERHDNRGWKSWVQTGVSENGLIVAFVSEIWKNLRWASLFPLPH
jgi:hypothetical protein